MGTGAGLIPFILVAMTHLLPWLFAVLSGLCLALAMPGPGLGPLALLFPVFLMEALERERGKWMRGNAPARTPASAPQAATRTHCIQ